MAVTMFSNFTDGLVIRTSDITVGLRDGINTQFDNTGVADSAGNNIITYGLVGTNSVAFNGTGSISVPVGTTGQRPTAAQGAIRLNTTAGFFEVSTDGSTWVDLAEGGGGITLIDGTTNQINSDQGIPTTTLSLSSTLVLPGTLTTANTVTLSGLTASELLQTNSSKNVITSNTLPSGCAATNLTLTTPILGTPQSGNLVNCTGYPATALGSISNNTILANISGGTASPAADTLTAIIDSCIGSTQGDILYRGASAWSVLAPSTSGYFLQTQGSAANPIWAATPAPTGAALTEVNDTNVTLTLGGTPSTALLQATSITAGWTGQLAVSRGGSGASTLTGLLTGNGTSAFTATAITQYNVLTAGASNLPNSVAPSSTSGVPLISQGSSAQPIFGTAVVAGGGTGITSATAYMPIVGGTTSTGALQSVSTSGASAGYVLTFVSTSAVPTWQSNPSGGNYIYITQKTASSSSSLAFTSLSSTYLYYEIILNNILAASSGASFVLQCSTNNGSSYDTGTNYVWTWAAIQNANANPTAAGGATYIEMTTGLSTSIPINGKIQIYNADVANNLYITYDFYLCNSSGIYQRIAGAGTYTPGSTPTVNAIQLLMTSGNITSGTLTLYGITT